MDKKTWREAWEHVCNPQMNLMDVSLALQTILWEIRPKPEQPTTAQPTQTAPIQEEPSVVGSYKESGMPVDTTPMTPQSLQSDQVDTKSGIVVPPYECAHSDKMSLPMVNAAWRAWWCPDCGALKRIDKILVPAVLHNLSISVKQPSNKSVESFPTGSALLQLKDSINHGWWPTDFQQIYGKNLGSFHFHSAHSHEYGDKWHKHEFQSYIEQYKE